MSQRPRFGGEGILRLPSTVSILRADGPSGRARDVVGEFGPEGWDPFGRTDEDLLLAEAFARFDFTRPRHAQRWFRRHGVADVRHLFPDDPFGPREEDVGDQHFRDPLWDVLDQQRIVRWHLLSLARLSAVRPPDSVPRASGGAEVAWDPAWSQPALLDPNGAVRWLGATSDYEACITPPMRTLAHAPEDLPRNVHTLRGLTPHQMGDEWWPAAHAAWQRIMQRGFPVLWVPLETWRRYWPDLPSEQVPESAKRLLGGLRPDWHGLVELQCRLLEPYLRRTGRSEVWIERSIRGPDTAGARRSGAQGRAASIEVHEQRWWHSLLVPITLQLLEGLRRVTEGRSGATFCKECGQPFLTLDARRSSFCNDRERFRFSQREQRRRAGASSSTASKEESQ